MTDQEKNAGSGVTDEQRRSAHSALSDLTFEMPDTEMWRRFSAWLKIMGWQPTANLWFGYQAAWADREADIQSAVKLKDDYANLRAKTAIHIGFTDVPTGYRVNLYAPDKKCFEIAGERPLALQIAGRTDAYSFRDTDKPPIDIRTLIDPHRGEG